MIAPFTPGSPVDVVARLMAQHLSTELKQSVVVENRPGAGTTIGMKAASLAEPDGYTLLFQSSSLVVAPAMYKNLDYDPLKSFTPVSNVAWGSWVTVVPPSLPVHSPQELIAYAKAHPGTLNFGYGQGTAPQLVGEWFNKTQRLAIAGVPYKGGMQAITDMLGGTIQLNIGTTRDAVAADPLGKAPRHRAMGQAARGGACRRADHDRERFSRAVARLLGRLVGAGRHAAADRRRAQPRGGRRAALGRDEGADGAAWRRTEPRLGAGFREFHRRRDPEMGRHRQGERDPDRLGPAMG